jgi:DNA-binding transcriptional LysR family regulator
MDGQNPRDAISTRLIEIFLAVIKVGTVSRAAETLGISQPAVSTAIA